MVNTTNLVNRLGMNAIVGTSSISLITYHIFINDAC